MNKTFTMSALKALTVLGIAVLICCSAPNANSLNPKFRVIAFFTAKQDQAHISFVNEARSGFLKLRRNTISAIRAHPTGRI
jgi:hypothetical protein